MKDFEFYTKIERTYEIKLIPDNKQAPRHTWNNCTLEKALKGAYNIARAHKTNVKVLLRPEMCKDLLFLEAFVLEPNGNLFDKTQDISLDYTRQDGTHGNPRFNLPI